MFIPGSEMSQSATEQYQVELPELMIEEEEEEVTVRLHRKQLLCYKYHHARAHSASFKACNNVVHSRFGHAECRHVLHVVHCRNDGVEIGVADGISRQMTPIQQVPPCVVQFTQERDQSAGRK